MTLYVLEMILLFRFVDKLNFSCVLVFFDYGLKFEFLLGYCCNGCPFLNCILQKVPKFFYF